MDNDKINIKKKKEENNKIEIFNATELSNSKDGNNVSSLADNRNNNDDDEVKSNNKCDDLDKKAAPNNMNEQNVNNYSENISSVKLDTNNTNELSKDTEHRKTSKKGSKRNFLRSLFSCGGSCTGSRSNSDSIINKTSKNRALSKPENLSTSVQSIDKGNTDLILRSLEKETKQLKKDETSQFQSETNLNNFIHQVETFGNSYEYASYESIIDKFVNSKMCLSNENSLSPNKLDTNETVVSTQNTINEQKKNLKLVLPILKINDSLISARKELHSSNTDESVSIEEYEEEEDEEDDIIEIDEDEDEEEYSEDDCEGIHNAEFDSFHLDADNIDGNLLPEYHDLKHLKLNELNRNSTEKTSK